MLQHYELLYIVPIKYLDDELQKISQMINGLIVKFNGKVTSEKNLGKQRLAYPIKQIHQGTYIAVECDMETGDAKSFDAQLKLTPEVLRHLIIKKKIKTAKEIEQEERIKDGMRRAKEDELAEMEQSAKAEVKRSEVVEVVGAPKTERAKGQEKKATLEELDKKLDEILTDDII